MAAESCPPAGKYLVIVTVAQTFLFRFWERPTGTRSFSLRLMIPERVLFAKRHSMP